MRRGRLAGILALVVLTVARRPEVLLHAQFWAEDGTVWYAEAYNTGGLRALFVPVVGYFQTLPRLTALLGTAVPLSLAPLLFNLVAVTIQILPVAFLLSDRLAGWASRNTRFVLAFIYVVLPNSHQVHGNITNSQWHLATLAVLILAADPPPSRLWAAFDLTLLAACALTGPFAIVLAPLAVWVWVARDRERWRGVRASVIAGGALLMAATLLFSGSARIVADRAASPILLVHILARQVVLPLFVGRRGLYDFVPDAGGPLVVAILAVALFLGIQAYVRRYGPLELKLVVLFGAGVLAASLARPMVESPQWPILAAAGGIRYWLIPMFSLCASAAWLAGHGGSRPSRFMAAAMLIAMLGGIVQDFGHPRYADLDFPEHVREFESRPAGARVEIPINPEGWSMTLIRR